jgi:YhcH/YjgK/YiaL family protein
MGNLIVLLSTMIFARIEQTAAYRPLLQGKVWDEVFAWIDHFDPTMPDGIHTIRGEEIFVNLHRYDTLHRNDCRWESHRRYLDLQFCIEGEETIDIVNRSLLSDDGTYDEEKDLLFHLPEIPSRSSSSPASSRGGPSSGGGEVPMPYSPSTIRYSELPMSPGAFAIFMPTDAHRPKVRPAIRPTQVRKFVVKIAVDAL